MANEKPSIAILVAVIGALATLGVACITGVFGLVQVFINSSEEVPTALVLVTPAQVIYTSTAPATPPVSTPTPGLLFASQVAANGQAIDPGNRFKQTVSEIYAVFPADMPPPGTQINVTEPEEGAYYAFLKINANSNVASIGWRWILDGDTVNEFSTEVSPNDEIWLSSYNYEQGVFSTENLGPGTYRVIILLGGNPVVSGEMIIEP